MSGAHTVEPGETLSGIAAKYGLQLNDLIAWNGISDPNVIRPGQQIELSGHLPAQPGHGGDREYVVQPGDTLTGIAAAHNASWKGIQVANNLADPDAITVGQKLIIPELTPG